MNDFSIENLEAVVSNETGGEKTVPKELISRLRGTGIPLHVIVDHLKVKKSKPVRSWGELESQCGDQSEWLSSFLGESLCFGRKSAYVYSVSNDLSGLFDRLVEEAGEQDVLVALSKNNNDFEFFKGVADSRFYVVSLRSSRTALETKCLTSADLNEDARKKFWKENSVIRMQSEVLFCAFDSVVYDAENEQLIVLVDDLRYASTVDSEDLVSSVLAYIDKTGVIRKSITPVDLFLSIKEMYSSVSEGIVTKLSFECGTGAVRDERLKQGQLDLRNEKYHVTGKLAVGELYPYRIEIAYHPQKYKSIVSEVVLGIFGRRSNLARKSGVFNFEISSSATFGEVKFCSYRISLYIQNEPTA